MNVLFKLLSLSQLINFEKLEFMEINSTNCVAVDHISMI